MSSYQKLDYHSMSTEMLKTKRHEFVNLKALKGNLLPDGGKKLDDAIDLISSIIALRKSQPVSEPKRIPAYKIIRENKSESIQISSTIEEASESDDEELNDISQILGSINIANAGDESEDEIDTTKLPEERLTSQEIEDYLGLLRLPSMERPKDILYHPFAAFIELLLPKYIYLRVIDCLDSKNVFYKYGSLYTWNLTIKSAIYGEIPVSHKPPISHPGCVVSELWNFIDKALKGSKNIPTILFETDETMRTFRTMFCNTSVQHYPGAKDLPRNIQFGVSASSTTADSSEKENRAIEDIISLDDHLAKIAKSYSKDPMTSSDLAKMKPKSVTWLEAPLNYRALLNISKAPTDAAVEQLSNQLASTSIGTPKEAKAATAPILSSFDDALLRSLALAGFKPKTLSLLSAKGGWRGFAGLLTALGICKDSPEPIAELYKSFAKVNRGLAINTDLYNEHAKKASVKSLYNESGRKTIPLLRALPIPPQRPEDRIPIRMPPPSQALLEYRDHGGGDSDDSSDSETADVDEERLNDGE